MAQQTEMYERDRKIAISRFSNVPTNRRNGVVIKIGSLHLKLPEQEYMKLITWAEDSRGQWKEDLRAAINACSGYR